MTERKTQGAAYMLIVTGPLRDRLYRRFERLYSSASDVRVVKDRRQGERRRTLKPHVDERQSSERRRTAPEWVFPPEPV